MNKENEDLILEKLGILNTGISDVKNSTTEIAEMLQEIKNDTGTIRKDLASINYDTTKAINNTKKIKTLSAIFLAVIYFLIGILIYKII